MKQRITIIGAGNLATHLAFELHGAGYKIHQVYSRTMKSAEKLASQLNAQPVNSTTEIAHTSDIYIVALKDSAVHEVLSKIDFQNKTLCHCSGSLPLSVLTNYSNSIGVFYPLQTFSQGRKVDFQKIPVFVEANNLETEKVVFEMAQSISDKVSVLDSANRKSLHISAVFACNFVNYFYTLAADFLETRAIPFDVLRPLILETAQKVQEMNPEAAQTGPAVRFDENIIKDHLQLLNDFPEHKELYKSISKGIFDRHQEKKK